MTIARLESPIETSQVDVTVPDPTHLLWQIHPLQKRLVARIIVELIELRPILDCMQKCASPANPAQSVVD